MAGPLDANYWKGPGSRQGGEREYVAHVSHPEVPEVVGTLSDGAHNGGGSTARTRTRAASSPSQHYPELPEVAWCLQHRDAKGADSDTKPGHVIPVGGFFEPVAFDTTHKPMSNEDAEGWSPQDHSPTITYWPRDRSDAGTDVAVVQPMAFAQNQLGELRVGSVTNTLNTNSNASGRNTPMVVQPLAFDAQQSDTIIYGDKSGPLDTDGHSVGVCVTGDRTHALKAEGADASEDGTGRGNPIVNAGMSVRRLTPTECERLQGFPDGWTAIPWKGKPAAYCPDGPRYKALGNSMAVPVIRWIARKIESALP